MTVDDLMNCYKSAEPCNYSLSFINDQLEVLNSKVSDDYDEITPEDYMILSIVCSALRYYMNTSPDSFQDNIVDIIVKIENIYSVSGMLNKILMFES